MGNFKFRGMPELCQSYQFSNFGDLGSMARFYKATNQETLAHRVCVNQRGSYNNWREVSISIPVHLSGTCSSGAVCNLKSAIFGYGGCQVVLSQSPEL